MNNTVLKIIAGLLALGAVAVGFLGVRLSQQPANHATPVAAPAPAATEPVLVAVRAVKAGQPLSVDDIAIKALVAPPAQALRQASDALGKTAMVDIAAGAPIVPGHFASNSLSSLLRQGERAVAVQVDEVIGLGGFAKPGDHVDLLSFHPASVESNNNTYAHIAIHDARLLAFGEASQLDAPSAAPHDPLAAQADSAKAAVAERAQRASLNLRSAVLAVKESDATELMLAAHSGPMRLALRPPSAPPSDAMVIQASNVGATAASHRQLVVLGDQAPPARGKPNAAPTSAAARASNVIIQEGSQERRLTANAMGL